MERDTYTDVTHEGYPVGHCWYYRLGGEILKPKAIRAVVIETGYGGYLSEDINRADQAAEPARSQKLRALKDQVLEDLSCDLSRYRQVAFEIHGLRREGIAIDKPITNCPYMTMSLRYAHVSNGFAHLARIDALLTQQGDLFG